MEGVLPQSSSVRAYNFRVLWSSDLNKKTQKWNDGIVHYYVFNRKCYVYDTDMTMVVSG